MEKDLSSLYSQRKNEGNNGTGFGIKLFKSVLDASSQRGHSLLDDDQSLSKWTDDVFTQSVIYRGSDNLIWGEFFICVYKSPRSNELSAIVFDKLGTSCFESVDISSSSQYYPAVENLSPSDQESNVKKCIAVVLLQRYPLLSPSDVSQILSSTSVNCDYDPPHAGDLASSCQLITAVPPEDVGKRLFASGFLRNKLISSALLDVVYKNNESTIELNNRLVFHLGKQLEQLFNPVTEYSPEQTECGYKAPDDESPTESDDVLVKAICNELLQLQTNFTFNLVEFLQKFLISLRVRVLNEEINGLSTMKLNRLFPPTIDEVTRINCIFLDSLKTATPYGSLEVLKACSMTIPYFYKAYTRHEAATKNFSKDIKLFTRHFSNAIPERDIYTEMKIESIIRGPQEKLLKLKLIVERLWKSKKWKPENQEIAKKCYENVIDVIDSFGNLDSPIHSYNTRVFTPSGKILTELAKCWPVELQYKWLKRRVVGVYDVEDINDESKKNLLVIFSDYVVFINILEAKSYYTSDGSNRPLISDILMNSLINEVPLPAKIPKLKVERHCYIDEVLVFILNESTLRFDCLKGKDSFSIVCKLSSAFISSSSVADLITKARILEKDTAFHLFKASRNNFTLYSTAHELCAYDTEKIKSKFALFLNIPPSEEILELNNLHLALFAKFCRYGDGDNLVCLDILTKHEIKHVEITPDNIVSTIINQLAIEIPICYSSLKSPMVKDLLFVNENLIKNLEHQLKDVKRNSAKGLEASGNEINNVFNLGATHEKKRSYGTITTFRSYRSDLKVSSPADKGESSKKTKQTSLAKPANKPRGIPKKKEIARNDFRADHIGKKSIKKSNGFFGVLKNVFGNKKKSKSLPSQNGTNKGSQTLLKPPAKKQVVSEKKYSSKIAAVSSPKKKKKRTSYSREESRKNRPSPEELESPDVSKGPYPQGDVRISSVIRDTEFGPHSFPQPAADSSESEKDTEREEGQNSRQDSPSNLIVMGQSFLYSGKPNVGIEDKITKKVPSQIPEKEVLLKSVHAPTADKVNTVSTKEKKHDVRNEARRIGDVVNTDADDEHKQNESRLFNDDLFGDFILKHSDDEESGIIGSNHLCQKEDLLKEKGVLNTSSNISSRTDDNASTLMRKPSLQMSKVPTKNSSGPKDTQNEFKSTISEEDFKYKAPKKETAKAKNIEKERNAKQEIFPTIPRLTPPASKISFQRSPSYIELFRGMRVVLDKHDAHYNWKRLASQVSLSDGLKVNTEENVTMAYKSHGDTDVERMTQISEVIDDKIQQPIPTHLPKRDSDNSSNGNSDDEFFEIEDELKEELQGGVDTIENSGGRSQLNQVPRIAKPPVFKVIKKSPVRIIGKTFEGVIKYENSSPSDASFTYDTHNEDEPDKRLMELKFPSQEEIPDDRFYTPAEEPTAAFPVVESSNSLENGDVATINNKTADDKNCSNNERRPTELLDDLEFSSFNIAFGNTSMSTDNIKVASDWSSNKTVLENPAKVQESPNGPLIYVLPHNSINREKDGLLQKKDNDEPIWISPSKIDFMTLSKRAKALSPERNTAPVKNNNGRKYKNTAEESIGNMTHILLSKDASYAYLTDFVSLSENEGADGKENCVADGPERLRFY
ncbi:hypothetical protein SKDZ_03G0510 [Saccharomyces kudriavzevii ZP591]|nr:hypothetical protein SKDZ_03G0510 [Saccharomyces kudriavzevii ZP591]